jgi:hypothetical protein
LIGRNTPSIPHGDCSNQKTPLYVRDGVYISPSLAKAEAAAAAAAAACFTSSAPSDAGPPQAAHSRTSIKQRLHLHPAQGMYKPSTIKLMSPLLL